MRQESLDFAAPVPRLNSTAPVERKRELQRGCYRALDCLLEHYPEPAPRSALEEWTKSHRFSARLAELRPFLARLCGRAWVPGVSGGLADPLPCTQDKATGAAWFGLREWAVDAAREASRRYWLARAARQAMREEG